MPSPEADLPCGARTFLRRVKTVNVSITHGSKGDIVGLYTALPWGILCKCKEVGKLEIGPREGRLTVDFCQERDPGKPLWP